MKKLSVSIIILFFSLFFLSLARLQEFITIGREIVYTYQINGFFFAFIGLSLSLILNIFPIKSKLIVIIINLIPLIGYLYTAISCIFLFQDKNLDYLAIRLTTGAYIYLISFCLWLISVITTIIKKKNL